MQSSFPASFLPSSLGNVMYFSWLTDHKKGFKSLSALTFPSKIGPHARHILLESVGVHVFQCIFMCVPMSMRHSHKYIKKNYNLNATVITLHFSRKKGASLQKSICKRSNQTVQHLAVSFSVCTALLLPCLALSLPSLSPSPVRLPPEHCSSDKHSLSCFPKQPQRAAISLSHLIWVFAFFPGRGDRAPVEPWPCRFQPLNNNNNNNKKVWQVPLPTCFSPFQVFWVHEFVTEL